MPIETYNILNRFSGEVQCSVEIDCAPDCLPSVKLGLAVKAAIKENKNLRGANLRGANLGGANLGNANLGGAYLGNAYLRNANLGGANLEGAYLGNAKLENTYLGGAYLGNANLENTYLGGANLENANLGGANLGNANLGSANLEGANLGNAYLRNANLGGAYLEGAYLEGANLEGAIIKDDILSKYLCEISRSDGYRFIGFTTDKKEIKIKAGCRWFTPKEYRAHIEKEYSNRDNGDNLTKETLSIIKHIELLEKLQKATA
jgi:hypothetical protein